MTDLLQDEITGPPVTVTIDGRTYPVAFTMAAAIAYKKATGKSLFDIEESKQISLTKDPERWLACLWAGLQQENSAGEWAAPLSLQELKRLRIADSRLVEIDAAMWSAFGASTPRPKVDPDPNAGAPAATPAPQLVTASSQSASNPESTGSTPAPGAASDSAAASS